MMNSQRRTQKLAVTLLTTICCSVLFASVGLAQDMIKLTNTTVTCIKENKEAYLSSSLEPIIFFPNICPYIPDEIAMMEDLLSNTRIPDDELAIIISKKELGCLIEFLELIGEIGNRDVEFSLDTIIEGCQ